MAGAEKLMKILISTSSFGAKDRAPLALLEEAGYEVQLNPHGRKLTVSESQTLLTEVDGLIAGVEILNEEVFDAAPNLKVISRVGVGMDAVDMAAASARNIQVVNTPDAHVDAVAELALSGLLNGLRKQVSSAIALREGRWERQMGRLLKGRSVGLIGLGKVGQALVQLLEPFGVTIRAYDPYWPEAFAEQYSVKKCVLAEVLAESEAVSLHVPGGGEAIISAPELSQIKPDCVLVNTARGGLIDENALFDFLTKNPNAMAVLDVFESEPYDGPLAKLENTILSAHLGAFAVDCRVAMETQAAENLLARLQTA